MKPLTHAARLGGLRFQLSAMNANVPNGLLIMLPNPPLLAWPTAKRASGPDDALVAYGTARKTHPAERTMSGAGHA